MEHNDTIDLNGDIISKEMNLPFTMFVVSDLHLEFVNKSVDKYAKMIPEAEVLILAGDIGLPNKKNKGHFSRFLQMCNESGKHNLILFVPGNHEYWSELNDREMDEICEAHDIIMLQNEMIVYEGVTFIGSTLWTNLTPMPAQMDLMMMNDFHKIPGLDTTKWKQLHKTAINSIIHYLDDPYNQNRKCIVITHHAPSYLSIPNAYRGDVLNACYYTHLHGLFEKPNLVAWIFGHTHKTLCKHVGSKEDMLLFGNSGRSPGEYDLKRGWNNCQDDVWNKKYVKDIEEYEC